MLGFGLSPIAVGQAGQPHMGIPAGLVVRGSVSGRRQRFVPVGSIQAAKENGINREGEEEGTTGDLCGLGAG